MKTMATAEMSCGGFMEESPACESGAVALRRRRMEIRRFKMLTNANTFVEQPVSKRLRPVSGISYIPREDEAESLALCVTDRDNAVFDSTVSVEWRQENSARGLSVCEVIRKPKKAASSLFTAWERPPGGDCTFNEGNVCAKNAIQIIRNSSSDRMSCGGSSSLLTEESDGSSTLTSIEGYQNTMGNEEVKVADSKFLPSGSDGSGTAGMVDSTATDTLTLGGVDIQRPDMAGLYLEHNSPWQGLGAENSLAFSSAVFGGAEGSSVSSNCIGSNECPSHSMVSLCGRRREMEDAVVSKSTFTKLPCSKAGGCNATGSELTSLHFFGVYDGHGGSQAANFCAERLHQALAEEVESCFAQEGNAEESPSCWESLWQIAMTRCFKRIDAEVGGFCLREGECPASGNSSCCPEPVAPETVGSTATVAVVGSCQIIVGNCGDSRAVLSRGGVAIPLSVDHKPEREDEMARVEAAGGRVIYWNGYRVLGVLAMSRAIGDRYLKPYVIAEPEVKCIKRAEDDECLILASDGLWDVMSNEAVCDIARRALNCKRNGHPATDGSHGTLSDDESPAAQAAALLVKLALAKGSSDNISVVVVDLKIPRSR